MYCQRIFSAIGRRRGVYQKTLSITVLIGMSATSFAQSGNGTSGISEANQLVGSYFDVGCNLLLTIGAVVGLIGAVKVYNAWSHGEQNTNKLAASWFGACIFLVVVSSVLKSFFGVQ